MKALELILRGLAAGFIIAAPVGPVNVLCISRTISRGWKSGLLSGLGAAAADTFYGCIAGFSITFVIQFLVKEEFWIRLIGAILLVSIGVSYYFKDPQPLKLEERASNGESDFVSTFLLTLTNPTTVMSFMAVLAALGMGERRPIWLSLLLVAGIFCGSTMWWLILVGVVNRARDRFTDRAMFWINRIAGLAIGGFGVLAFVLSRGRS
jgi:threonine/homoserine/homoserine lactone efflux protein